MCRDCMKSYGELDFDSDKTKEAVKLIKNVYEYSSAGGGLHIVLDDWNIDDHDIRWAIENHRKYVDNYDIEQSAAQEKCIRFMESMTLAERNAALAIHWFGEEIVDQKKSPIL